MDKHIVLAFGRFQGVTAGHQKVFEKLNALAKKYNGTAHVHMSWSNDAKRNPLKHDDKVKFAKKMMPHLAHMFESDPKIRTPFHMLAKYSDPEATIHMVAGGDRVADYQAKFDKYNGKDYTYKKIIVHNAGERTDGISGTVIRNMATADNFEGFKKFAPSTAKEVDVKAMFELLRKGLLVEGWIKTIGSLLSEKVETDEDDEKKRRRVLHKKGVVINPLYSDYQKMATHDDADTATNGKETTGNKDKAKGAGMSTL